MRNGDGPITLNGAGKSLDYESDIHVRLGGFKIRTNIGMQMGYIC